MILFQYTQRNLRFLTTALLKLHEIKLLNQFMKNFQQKADDFASVHSKELTISNYCVIEIIWNKVAFV